ncbi:MAG: hypothetical protein IJY78_08490, partial [Bacteroidaceae bacterium]|nr:hypothetical protein [Bacteroidaceae bacterium]
MRRYILILLLMWLHCVAHGQTEYTYRYWFDNASVAEYGGSATDSVWTLELDVDDFSEGLHQFHFQVMDTAGVWSIPHSRMFLKTKQIDVENLKIRYWFDDGQDIKEMQGSSGLQTIDVSELSWGLHTVNFQVAGSNGVFSPANAAMFLKTRPVDVENLKIRYWFDDGQDIKEMQGSSGLQTIDVSELSWGLHTVNFQVAGSNGVFSPANAATFFKARLSAEDYKVQCYVNDSLYCEQIVPKEGGIINWNLDVSSLPRGLHYVRMQVNDPDLSAVSVAQSFFWRELSAVERSATRCLYSIDGVGQTEVPVMDDGGYRFDVDVNGLSEGLHQLLCMIVSPEEAVLQTAQHFFMVRNNNVMRYDYWVNDDTLNTRTVVATQAMEPFRVMESLDVATYPIRPSSFHFEVADSIPYIYAKNELHARFYSSNGAWTEDSAEYADELSRKEVVPMLLPRNSNERTDKTPEADSIRWYCLETKADNALSFKVSQPCTMQLFSPDGEPLLNVSGEEVTDTISCHTPSDGLYYLAIHSVTGTDSLTTVSYLNNFVTFHKMTYVIDGKEYHTEIVAYGDSIVPLTPPDNENRPFSGWKGITEVMPGHDLTVEGSFEYKLRYVVEDSVWHEVSYYYGETIDDTYYADKEWYDFEEWEGMPETMPAQDVSVTAKFVFRLEMGDVNADERVSVTDVTVLTNHILKKPNTVFVRDAADMNGDG